MKAIEGAGLSPPKVLQTANVAIFSLNTHFLLDFGDLDKSFSFDKAHASMALRSLNHDFIIHEALVLVLRLVG